MSGLPLLWVKAGCVCGGKRSVSVCVCVCGMCVCVFVCVEGGVGVWVHADGSQANLSIRSGV